MRDESSRLVHEKWLANIDASPDRKRELVEVVYGIVESCIDRAMGVDPTQFAAERKQLARRAPADRVGRGGTSSLRGKRRSNAGARRSRRQPASPRAQRGGEQRETQCKKAARS